MAKFLSKEEEREVIDAIKEAEKSTSGEIRVHIDKKCKKDPLERAKEIFGKLKMHETEQRNGVILYLSAKDHKIAIWGDEGIHEKVGQKFWEDEMELLVKYFKAGDYATGLSEVIKQIGEKLSEFFPYQRDDINELSNEISYKKEDVQQENENEEQADD